MKTFYSFKNLSSVLLLFFFAATGMSEDGPRRPIPDLTKGGVLTRLNDMDISPIGAYAEIWRPRQRSKEFKL